MWLLCVRAEKVGTKSSVLFKIGRVLIVRASSRSAAPPLHKTAFVAQNPTVLGLRKEEEEEDCP